MVPWPPLPMGSGGRGRVLSVRMLSVGWGGGQPPVGPGLELPAALMDRPMMGSAHQDQVGQVGRAAIQPVDQMMGLTPGKGTITAGEDTAAVPHGQGGPLGGLDDPGGPADVQGWLGAPPRTGGSRLAAAWSRSVRVAWLSGRRGWWSPQGSSWWPWWLVAWRVTRTRVTAPSQASR